MEVVKCVMQIVNSLFVRVLGINSTPTQVILSIIYFSVIIVLDMLLIFLYGLYYHTSVSKCIFKFDILHVWNDIFNGWHKTQNPTKTEGKDAQGSVRFFQNGGRCWKFEIFQGEAFEKQNVYPLCRCTIMP